MSSDTNSENIYNASDVATLLNLKLSTLRKYASVLENAGYKYHKNNKGHRGYFDHDVIALRKLIELKSSPDMTLVQSANAVMSWVKEKNVSPNDTTDVAPKERHISYDTFKEFQVNQEEKIQQVIDLNKELLTRLDQQQEYLDNRLKQRDEQLMNALNQSLETKKQIASEKEEPRKTNFFKRLFLKK